MRLIAAIAGAFIVLKLGAGIFASPLPVEGADEKMSDLKREGFEGFKQSNQNTPGSSRAFQRRGAIKSLNTSWADFCNQSNRKALVGSITEYYWHRQNLIRIGTNSWGTEGRNFALGIYRTAEDSQIDRISQQLFVAGYLKVDDFRPATHEMFAEIVKNERVRGKACES